MRQKFLLVTACCITTAFFLSGCGINRQDPKATAIGLADAVLRRDIPAVKSFFHAHDEAVDAQILSTIAEMDWEKAIIDRFGPDGPHQVRHNDWEFLDFNFSDQEMRHIRSQMLAGTVRRDSDGKATIISAGGDTTMTLRNLSGRWYVYDEFLDYMSPADIAELKADTLLRQTFTTRLRAGDFATPEIAHSAWQAAWQAANGVSTQPAQQR